MGRLSSIGYVLAAALVSGCVSDASASFMYGVGGGGAVSVSEALTPTGSSPSSIADQAQLDAGMFTGWRVSDPNSCFASMTDDGSTFSVSFDSCSGDQEITNANAWLTNPCIYRTPALAGDFDHSVKFDAAANMGSAFTHFALASVNGDTTNESRGIFTRFGRWQTSNGRNTTYYSLGNGTLNATASDAVSWTATRWIRQDRTDAEITASKKVSDGDAWTDYDATKLDAAGAVYFPALCFYTPHTSTETVRFYAYDLSGTED